ncbi:hypothetical protein OG369_41530 [Streptomyces sp. NBC_01221]|uniref:hypothetical protein n=1 Tax=Streptomyces sp. NBC_01221 TaxID=2903782 RepID=UPI002256F00C|nr:hypothetical protein [Streptomyces sp. NBC_01221]MCX4792286.1 hypothetical protein [Streptomyces sp. NBC_01221]
MKRLELVVVQFEEVKRLIGIGRVPQLRLAHILLDSAVELIMHRMVEAELDRERYNFDQLENLRRLEAMRRSDNPLHRRFATGPSDDQLSAEIKKLEGMVTSKKRRQKINYNFGDKIDFLVERTRLPGGIAPVLKKLHDYRNETYHRDQHRVEVSRPAVLIYFDAACTVLDLYEPGVLIGDEHLGPELARFQDARPGRRDPFEVSHRAAKQLREEVGLDLTAVRTALVDHLLGRLDDLESGLAYVEENSVNGAAPGDAIRAMQIEDGDIEAIFVSQVLRSRKYPLTMEDVKSWVERATAMADMDDKHALFAELAALEDAFEDLESKVREAVWRIDEAANMR